MDDIKTGALNAIGAAIVAAVIWYALAWYDQARTEQQGRAAVALDAGACNV